MSKIGTIAKEIEPLNGTRGAKSKWGPLFQPAVDNPGKWVCVAEAEDEKEARKLYNNARGAAHRLKGDFSVALSQDLCVYVKTR